MFKPGGGGYFDVVDTKQMMNNRYVFSVYIIVANDTLRQGAWAHIHTCWAAYTTVALCKYNFEVLEHFQFLFFCYKRHHIPEANAVLAFIWLLTLQIYISRTKQDLLGSNLFRLNLPH